MRATFVKRTGRYLAIALVVLGLSLGMLPGFSATSQAQTSDAQGIQVSPVIIDLNGEKGGSYNLKLTVTNVTAGSLLLTSDVNNFTAGDETGNPKVILDDEADSSFSAKSWVSGIPSFTLKSKESRQITFNVNIPQNAEAGGHYGVIRFSGVPPEGGDQNVALNASVGVLLLARVNGNITESLVLKDLFAQKDGKRSSLFANGPIDLVARIENNGNVHVKPVGTLTVKDIFGRTVASYPFGSNTKNVLPDSIRRYDQSFDKRWMFGRYTTELQAGYGTSGAVLSGTTSFWVIPFKLIFFVLLLIALLVFTLKKLIGRYNKHIVQRSSRKH